MRPYGTGRLGMGGLAIAACLLVAACDDDSGDPGSYVAITDYATAGKAAWCTYLTRCGFFPDEATCTSANVNVPEQLQVSAELVAAVKAGHILYNGNNAKTCLDSFASATCDKTDEAGRRPAPECNQMFRGNVEADGACFEHAECMSGYCQISVADQTCAAGKCVGNGAPQGVPLAHQGEPCTFTAQCASDLICGSSSGTCEPLHTSGMSCVTTADCAYGLGCAGSTRTCQTLPAIGEPCPNFDCRDDGAHCTKGVCAQVGLPGAACASSAECSSYYTCDFTSTMCKRLPITGEPCTSGNSRCFDASFCDSSTLKCVPYRMAGEICSTSLQCASGECDFNTNECAEPTTCL